MLAPVHRVNESLEQPAESPSDVSHVPMIGVILINWNGWRDTVAAYRSLERSSGARWTAIVVDNASSDDSTSKLAEALPSAVLIRNPVNSGFAGGCNIGLRKARELGLTYAFLLNNDAEVLADTLDALLAASLELNDRAVLGSVVRYWPSGELQFFGSRSHPSHGGPDWYRESVDIALLKQPLIDSDFLIGAALFMPMAIFADVGELDEAFFLTYEETDWCYRARKRGWRVCVVANSVVRHAGSASLGGYDAPMQSYFLHRNRLLFSEKHATRGQRWKVLRQTWRSFRENLRKSHRAARARGLTMDPSKKAMLLGVRDYLLQRFGDCPPEVRQLARQARAHDDETKLQAQGQASH